MVRIPFLHARVLNVHAPVNERTHLRRMVVPLPLLVGPRRRCFCSRRATACACGLARRGRVSIEVRSDTVCLIRTSVNDVVFWVYHATTAGMNGKSHSRCHSDILMTPDRCELIV